MRGTAFRALWLGAAAALAGCSTFQPRTLRIDSAAGMYQGVTITYRVDGGQLSEPLDVARIRGQQVTHERLPSSPYPDQSIVRLSVRYPHPDGKAGYGLAEMVVETHRPPNAPAKKAVWQQWVDSFAATARDVLPGVRMSDDVYEAWALDISKHDLDRVVQGLSMSGYFVNPPKQTLGVQLAVRVDNFQASKTWSREPELDILLARLRQEGQLVSYVHPIETDDAVRGVAFSPNAPGGRLVSHEQEGPSLMPAGPQNNAYQGPSEPSTASSAPQTLPLPAAAPPAYSPPPPANYPPPGYAPPPANYPPPGYAPPPSRSAPLARPPYPPQRRTAAPPGRTPAANQQQPQPDPRQRWQSPQPYRRGAAPPGSAARAPYPGQPNSSPPEAPPPKPRFRFPWQRTPPPANAQPAGPPPASANAAAPDPRQRRLPRYPGAAGRSPSGGRAPARYPRPYGNSPAPPYNPNPQGGYGPIGAAPSWPQPPQVNR